MDGGSSFNRARYKRSKKKPTREQQVKLARKLRGFNEHHRQPRCRQGGRGYAGLNIVKVGIQVHRTYHSLFGADEPKDVVKLINKIFSEYPEYLVVVPTNCFPSFHRYFTSRQVIKAVGMSGYGLTWGHLFLYGTNDDLLGTFRSVRHNVSKSDPGGDSSEMWRYLFQKVTMPVMAFELTRYWLPLDSVIIAIPKEHRAEVDEYLQGLLVQKIELSNIPKPS
jgi:hypothetical protein